MRKLKLQVQLSIDGFITGANGEMDWMLFPWSDDLIEYVRKITEPADTILLGRKLAEGFIPHWDNVVKNPNDPEYEGAVKYSGTPKVVFTKTLSTSPWERTTVANGNLVNEVNKLKELPGGDLICYGGGEFVSSLIKENLIDELHLFVNPSIIGKGMQIFHLISSTQKYKLLSSLHSKCGIMVLVYQPIKK